MFLLVRRPRPLSISVAGTDHAQGYDGAAHLSEEMHDPARGVPFAIMGALTINGALGFAMLLALLFCLGDLTAATRTSTGFPVIEIFYNATGSISGAVAMSCAIVLMASLATIPLITSASRTV